MQDNTTENEAPQIDPFASTADMLFIAALIAIASLVAIPILAIKWLRRRF